MEKEKKSDTCSLFPPDAEGREKKCLTLAAYFLRLETPGLPACYPLTMVFPVVMYECESWTVRNLSAEELMLLDCGVGEDC